MKDWLTPYEVGQLVGFSANFIRLEIRAKEIDAQQIWSRGGKIGRYRISRAEAEAYRQRLERRGPQQRISISKSSNHTHS